MMCMVLPFVSEIFIDFIDRIAHGIRILLTKTAKEMHKPPQSLHKTCLHMLYAEFFLI